MPYNTSSVFPPIGNPVFRIDRNWCIGDSLVYVNANFLNIDTRIDVLSTNVFSLSSQFKSLSGINTPTLNLRFNNLRDTLSGEVVNNSLGTIKLGGDISQTSKALLTSASISALADVRILTPLNNETILWNSSLNRWENRPIILGAGASIATGSYGEIEITSTNNWTVRPGAITEIKINTGAVTESKILSGSITDIKVANNAAISGTKILPNFGSQNITGANITANGDIYTNGVIYGQNTAGTGDVLRVGNDSKLVDIDVANVCGIYGIQNSNIGGLKLGSAGPTIFGTETGVFNVVGNLSASNSALTQIKGPDSVILNSMSTSTTLMSATTAEAGLMTARDRQLFELLTEAIVLSGQFVAEYLLVAGGGGTVNVTGAYGSGGGGAGGVISSRIALNAYTSYNIFIGAGGSGGTSTIATQGSQSNFNGLIALGGARSNEGNTGLNGSGGGGTSTNNANNILPGGLGTFNQGFLGGSGKNTSLTDSNGSGGAGGGGGGATSPGGDAMPLTTPSTTLTAGSGGSGLLWFDNIWYAGGGGGGGSIYSNTTSAGFLNRSFGGAGGIGGGGQGGTANSNSAENGQNGTINTGGGAGGPGGGRYNSPFSGPSSSTGFGANGGSGVFIIRYPGPARAVGGSYAYDSLTNYSYHRFTQSGEFFTAFNPVPNTLTINYLAVAGGGGGGSKQTSSGEGAGGGAGGALSGAEILTVGDTRSITIGAGGDGSTAGSGTQGQDGQNTVYNGQVAVGGGGGAGQYSSNGRQGGSGGGSTYNDSTGAFGAPGQGIPGQGFNGGQLTNITQIGTGGGGARGSGATNSTTPGPGLVWLNGVTYATGGRGSPATSIAGPIGSGNGGDGAFSSASSVPGAAGGSGTVIISYLGSTTRGTGGNISVSNGYTHHVFLTGGTFTFTG